MSPTVANVYAFNHAQRALFESRPAAGVEAADLNVDISASMAVSPGKEQALRSVVASMVAGTVASWTMTRTIRCSLLVQSRPSFIG